MTYELATLYHACGRQSSKNDYNSKKLMKPDPNLGQKPNVEYLTPNGDKDSRTGRFVAGNTAATAANRTKGKVSLPDIIGEYDPDDVHSAMRAVTSNDELLLICRRVVVGALEGDKSLMKVFFDRFYGKATPARPAKSTQYDNLLNIVSKSIPEKDADK